MINRIPLLLLAGFALLMAACSGKIRDNKAEEVKTAQLSPEQLAVKDSLDIILLPALDEVPADIAYRISTPLRDPDAEEDSPLHFKSYLDVTDSLALDFVHHRFHSVFIPNLVDLLDDEKYAWRANVLLYHVTGVNAILMKKYQPGKNDAAVKQWEKEQKSSDLRMWKNRINQQDFWAFKNYL